MIFDKKLKMKVAENPMEALWYNVEKEIMQRIKQHENALIVDKKFLATCMVEKKKSVR